MCHSLSPFPSSRQETEQNWTSGNDQLNRCTRAAWNMNDINIMCTTYKRHKRSIKDHYWKQKPQTALTICLVGCVLKHKLVRGNESFSFVIHSHSQRYLVRVTPAAFHRRALNSIGKRTDNLAGITATCVSLRRRRAEQNQSDMHELHSKQLK